MSNLEKKYNYFEYFENDTHLKKLYNIYINKHIADKVLNLLVLTAIILTTMTVVLELLGDVNNVVVILVNSFFLIASPMSAL